MPDEMQVNDVALTPADIGALENADQLAHLFALLHYNIDTRTNIPDYAVLGIDTDDLRQQITRVELIAVDPVDENIKIYLFEVRSITAKLRYDIARRFRERPENALLILTKDYEDLEFVLLERKTEESRRLGQSQKLVIRPIPLDVNRRKPEAVKLRVLKRFTFTEEDSDYQWEKLRSAYVLAAWSEEYFNNRALFSDYYLKYRLTDTQLTSEWKENVHPIGDAVYSLLIDAQRIFSAQPERMIRQKLYEPLLTRLGFDFAPGKPNENEPDYMLYAKGDRSRPIAGVLTYVWNRNLDDVDTTRDSETPLEIPGALVVSLLEKAQVAWVIVTNGKLWRLYSSSASNKATNYYEVDLDEALTAPDQITALKYWWLMFRPQAFTGFLDRLLVESDKYAKALGDRLKDRVFVEIFPQFAKGFIADMRSKGRATLSERELAEVFSGTMTFLYRMMFILYAESLDLLPVTDPHGYGEFSLNTLKYKLKAAGGDNETDAPDLLRKRYTTKSTDIYNGTLRRLFHAIDAGDDTLNMPTYNGGLFSAENDGGRFLEQYAIPDQYLALGLDRLTRDEDDKTQKLVMIDFKSLGVRHLGSIYEGLLEFKLKIADEDKAIERDGKREVYVSLAKAKKQNATVAIKKSEVYLENDKQERKATGSYYTPDYIVKYIVEHTVGPVLDRKFAECRPRLRDAQKAYRQARDLAVAKGEDPSKFWQLQEPTSPMSKLVDDCLNIRVLDPAMGSGHFLVEAVDFVSNRLIDFLNGWTENPVWAALERIRDDIVADMERQHVTIDAAKLTRVALLKRAVLKRCVYGVDLNRMAVELAKVSLWLDAFTLGAPLSFLDHHLKWGNSLIGARYGEVRDAIESQQRSLFAQNKFGGLADAVRLMQVVSYLSDSTLSQAKESQQAFSNAVEKLAPYKRVLDVYTSRWFGNAPSKGKRGAIFDPTIEFLNRSDTWAWLEDPRNPANRLPADDYMKAGLVAKTALNAAEDKHFFHWEFEFPEVFFAPALPREQNVELREDGGFDAVVGNPPYGATSSDYVDANPNYVSKTVSSQDIYLYFIEYMTRLIQPVGSIGFITPNTWMTLETGTVFRRWNLETLHLSQICDVRDAFEDAIVETAITIWQSNSQKETEIVTFQNSIVIDEYTRSQEEWLSAEDYAIDFYLKSFELPVLYKIQQSSQRIGSLIEIHAGTKLYEKGKGTPPQTDITLKERPYTSYTRKLDFEPLLTGGDITRYEIADDLTFVKYGRWLAAPREERIFRTRKLVIRRTDDKLLAVIDDKGLIAQNSVHCVLTDVANPLYLLSLINSTMINWWYQKTNYHMVGKPFAEVKVIYVTRLPLPSITFTTPAAERERLVQSAVGLYDSGDDDGILSGVNEMLASNQTDVIHDLLVHLAQRMIDLNKDKQAEMRRFLNWLEGKLKIIPKNGEDGIDSLTGKTILQGYLGDYQKGAPAVAWADFFYRLHQNRTRFNGISLTSIEGEIQREYEQSLQVLLPIKSQLARTDALIDKIVYQLYGLTDAEIELIERPQFEQGLIDAKASVIADKAITDEDVKIERIAEGILPSAQRFFERIAPTSDKDRLDADLPGWDSLPPEVPTFLLTAEYTLGSMPDHLDFSASVIAYSKSVETTLHERIFAPFRAAGYTDHACQNEFLKKFMRGEKELTLGNFPIILKSSGETALRHFIESQFANAATAIYGSGGMVSLLNDRAMLDIRNAAAHDERLERGSAEQMRVWAFGILGRL